MARARLQNEGHDPLASTETAANVRAGSETLARGRTRREHERTGACRARPSSRIPRAHGGASNFAPLSERPVERVETAESGDVFERPLGGFPKLIAEIRKLNPTGAKNPN